MEYPSPMRSRFLLSIALISISLLTFSFIVRQNRPSSEYLSSSAFERSFHDQTREKLKVFVADLPPEFNYGLLREYWEFEISRNSPDSNVAQEVQQYLQGGRASAFPKVRVSGEEVTVLPYPEDPLIKQYSAEYWLLGDLMTSEAQKENSVTLRVWDSSMADVIFVPFFATLSAELQLHKAKGKFRHRKENADYDRQRRVVEFVKGTREWLRSGGRDHVFVVTDPVAMWHVKEEIAPAVLLTVDFGGWYMEDAKSVANHTGPLDVMPHRQVSLLKDVIVPYTHLLPVLQSSEDQQRNNFLYFRGARHRHRTGLVRDKLWAMLKDEPGVVFEEGFPNATGKEQAIKGMHGSEFCLHPAGDTPTSCRLFDAVVSLCIPVIISDSIELPFEGTLDYTQFSLFVSVHNALQPGYLMEYLKGIPFHQRKTMRDRIASVQHFFQYDNGYAGAIGPVLKGGAVNMIWNKVRNKVPYIKEAITRERRKPADASVPGRCQCL